MTKDEANASPKDAALRLALEYVELVPDDRYNAEHIDQDALITAIKAALEAKDEKANDELCRLHDLLGKANALARIRAAEIESMKASLYGLYELEKQRDELEQRLTKTEAQLGEAMWNYGELKREQLANQQKTSGSPINTSAALEAKDEPVAFKIYKPTPPRGAIPIVRDAELPWVYDQDPSSGNVASMWVTPVKATPPQRKPLTDEEMKTVVEQELVNYWDGEYIDTTGARDCLTKFARAIEAAHGIKGEA